MPRDWWQTDPTYVIDDPPKGFECPPIFEFCWTNDAREWTSIDRRIHDILDQLNTYLKLGGEKLIGK